MLQQVGHVKQDLPLCSLIETVRNIDRCQYVDQHTMVWLLVELPLLLSVVLVELNPDKFKDLGHEFLLIEFKCFKK